MDVIETALQRADETRAVVIGSGVISEAGLLFKKQFPGMRAIIVADPNTYDAAGRQVYEIFQNQGVLQDEPYIFTDPDLYAEYTYIDMLTSRLRETDAIPVAVGSGTINDLTKLSAFNQDRPYMVVATAASMDGYTAYGASITIGGSKQSVKCSAPQACLADIAIISQAPAPMTASGYADLFAKITAGADWILAEELGVESIDPFAWHVVQDGLKPALADPEGARLGRESAIRPLTEGLLLGGFAMQAAKTSRPASGAEHQFSHLWDMEHLKFNGKTPSHGFKVGVGMCAITQLYEKILAEDMTRLNIRRCVEVWPNVDEQEQATLQLFEDSDIPNLAVRETIAKYSTPGRLSDQLLILKNNWPRIKERLSEQLLPLDEVKRRLKLVGAPTEPEEIGVSQERMKNSFLRAQMIRRRFTILDVALRTGNLR